MAKERKGCLGLILSWFRGFGQSNESSDQWPYRSKASLLTPAEVSFYHVLASVVKDRAVICPKVGMKDILFIPGPHDKEYYSYFGRISQKHVDFVLCRAKSMEPFLAIELDDTSHGRQDRSERDTFVDKAFDSASLPLIHITAAQTYNTGAVASTIEPYLLEVAGIQNKVPITMPANQTVPPICPRHGIVMVLRTAMKGPNAGQQFYGCPNYPDCREIVRLG